MNNITNYINYQLTNEPVDFKESSSFILAAPESEDDKVS